VTVAKEIELENNFGNMGRKWLKKLRKNQEDAGDGTTTATVLVKHLQRRCKLVSAGHNPMDLSAVSILL